MTCVRVRFTVTLTFYSDFTLKIVNGLIKVCMYVYVYIKRLRNVKYSLMGESLATNRLLNTLILRLQTKKLKLVKEFDVRVTVHRR
jgi:hypothetical protein